MFEIENRAKPILKWAGGKSQLLSQLVPLFPQKFETYIEPFMGGGAVALALKPGTPMILNDGNPELVNLYEVVRDKPEELMAALDRLAAHYSEEFYYKIRGDNPQDPVEMAARTVFLNKSGFNGLYRQNAKGGFNVPFGKRTECPGLYEKENLLDVSRRLSGVMILSGDFVAAIEMASSGDFVYCDPPYEPISETSSFNAYKGGGFSQKDQARLKEACVAAAKRGAIVAISNSSAAFILDLYADCDVRMVKAKRAINSKGRGRGEVDEVLVLIDHQEMGLASTSIGDSVGVQSLP